MINKMDINSVISLHRKGNSFRSISKLLNIDRKTVSKIVTKYLSKQEELLSSNNEFVDDIVEDIIFDRKYDTSNRRKVKLTTEIQRVIISLLNDEEEKKRILGRNKQSLNRTQIYHILKDMGYDIGLTTVNNFVKTYLEQYEVFIKQEYKYGERLEYDFGEVKLLINGIVSKYYLAVFGAPASGFKWAYLYKNQKKDVFLDSHVRFFELNKGSWKEVVYDNMKNVVTSFIGRSEKILNDDLINLSLYYDFNINVTNVYSGNEKGFVEGAVKKIRTYVFAERYKFDSYEDACKYLNDKLLVMNKNSNIDIERNNLNPYRPKYELAEILIANVNKYSLITVDNNYYSVPDYLNKKTVTIKKYIDKIKIYSNNNYVCTHKKIDGFNDYVFEISHFLNTLRKKPGAIKNSKALNQYPNLKIIYQEYYKTKPKVFIEILIANKNKSMEEIELILKEPIVTNSSNMNEIEEISINQLMRIGNLYTTDGGTYGKH